MGLQAGSSFGPYRILEPLGRGGMAAVYKAYEAGLDRYVALKVLPGEFLHDEDFSERFRREARVIAKLEHPNIVPIHGFGIDEASKTPWMAMRLIPGGSLSSALREGLTRARVVEIVRGVADALDYAHSKGVVHRDVKPQNVLLDDHGRVYLADFGIARMLEGSPKLTQAGMITGTPQYMAPEQATGQPVDSRADVYALGIVAYEMLTGRVPFSADTPVAVLMKHVQEPMPLPSPAEVPEPLVRALLKALAKKPEDRWRTAAEFARALERGLDASSAHAALAGTMDLAAVPSTLTPQVPETLPAAAPTLPSAQPRPLGPLDGYVLPASQRSTTVGPGWLGRGVLIVLAAGFLLVLVLGAAFVWRLSNPKESSTAATGSVPTPAPSIAKAPAASAVVVPTAPPAVVEEQQAPPAMHPPDTHPIAPTTPAAAAVPARAAEERPAATPAAAGTLVLDVDAQQAAFGGGTDALYFVLRVDGRAVRSFTLLFSGASPFARSRKRQTVEIAGVPAGHHRLSLAASSDQSMSSDVFDGDTEMDLEEGTNRGYVQVRYMSARDREVRWK